VKATLRELDSLNVAFTDLKTRRRFTR